MVQAGVVVPFGENSPGVKFAVAGRSAVVSGSVRFGAAVGSKFAALTLRSRGSAQKRAAPQLYVSAQQKVSTMHITNRLEMRHLRSFALFLVVWIPSISFATAEREIEVRPNAIKLSTNSLIYV